MSQTCSDSVSRPDYVTGDKVFRQLVSQERVAWKGIRKRRNFLPLYKLSFGHNICGLAEMEYFGNFQRQSFHYPQNFLVLGLETSGIVTVGSHWESGSFRPKPFPPLVVSPPMRSLPGRFPLVVSPQLVVSPPSRFASLVDPPL